MFNGGSAAQGNASLKPPQPAKEPRTSAEMMYENDLAAFNQPTKVGGFQDDVSQTSNQNSHTNLLILFATARFVCGIRYRAVQ